MRRPVFGVRIVNGFAGGYVHGTEYGRYAAATMETSAAEADSIPKDGPAAYNNDPVDEACVEWMGRH